MKRCSYCKEHKSLSDFHKDRSQHDGLNHRCKPCAIAVIKALRAKNPEKHREDVRAWKRKNPERHLNRRLQNDYGITLEDYRRMETEQDGCCSICRKAAKLHVDHCHKTGVVRGLLCHSCNIGLGLLGDQQDGLRSALEYLERAALLV